MSTFTDLERQIIQYGFFRQQKRMEEAEESFQKIRASINAAASESLPQLTKGELEALIDFHDWNSSGAEAMEMIESSEYHEKRAAVFKAMRDQLEKEKVNAANR